MNLKFLTYFLFLLCAHFTSAQNEDSLLQIIEGNYPDSTRIKTQLHYSRLLNAQDPSKAIKVAQDASMLAIQSKEYLLAGEAFNQIGLFNYFQGDYVGAKENFSESGVYYELANEPKGIANSANNTGVIAYEQGYYFEALELYAKALVIRKSLQDSATIAVSYNNIGNVYKDIGNLEKSKEYYTKSIEYKEILKDTSGLAMTLNNLGLVHHLEKEYELAIEKFKRSIEFKQKIGEDYGLGMSYANIANSYLELGETDLAIENVYKSIEVRKTVGDNQGLLHSNLILSSILYKKGEYEGSKKLAQSTLDSALSYQANVQIKDAYLLLAKATEELGDYKNALYYQKQYSFWSDSLLNEENLRSTQQLEQDLEVQEQQEKIDSLQKQVNEIQPVTKSKAFWTLIILCITLVVILSLFLIFRTEKENEEEHYYNKSQLASLRVIFAFAAVVPTIYGYLRPMEIPNAFDPMIFRVLFGSLFLGIFISTFVSGWSKAKVRVLAVIGLYTFSIYLLFMAYVNNMHLAYFTDAILALAVTPAIFNKQRNALIFIATFSGFAFLFYFLSNPAYIGFITFVMLLITASAISFLVMVSKKFALKELKLANQIVNEADALVYISNAEGEHIYTSNSVSNILGYTPEEATAESFWQKAGISTENREKIRQYLIDLANGRIDPKPNQHHKYIAKNGEEKWILWKDKRIEGNRALGVGQDVTEMKKIQDQLKERESIFSQINDSLTETFYLYNIEKQQYEFISENCKEVMGAPQEFFFGGRSHTKEFVHPDDKNAVMAAKVKIEKGESYQIDYRVIIDEQIKWIRESSQPIFNDKNEIIKNSGICKDITEEKQTEEEIEKLSMVASLTSNYIIIAHTENGIEWVNDAFTNKFGYKLEECKGQFPSELMHFKPDSPVVQLINEVVFEHQRNFNGEMVHTTKDGTPIQAQVDIIPFVINNGKVEKYFVLGSDISEQKEQETLIKQSHKDLKKKERLLAESEGNFRELIKSIKEVFWLTDYKSKELLFVSKSFEEVFQFTTEEFKNDPRIWATNIHPDDKDQVIEQFLNFVHDPKSTKVDIDFRLEQNNEVKWLKARMFPILNEAGEVVKLSGLAEDITEQKNQELDLMFLNRKLEIINTIEKSILESETRNQIIYNALSNAIDKLPILRASLALFDYANQEFHSFTINSNGTDSLTDKKVFHLEDFSVYPEMKKNQKSILVDISKKEVKSKSDELLLQEGVGLTSMSPLLKGDELIGSFNVCFNDNLETDVNTYIAICNEIAQGLGVAIYQAQLKEEITEKNNDILGSINYALRIQESLIPREIHNNGAIDDAFIYYRPKDIVSGDFYFSTEHENQLIIVVGDCTGHGVPGGFMTVLGITHLERIVSLKKGRINPSELLEELDEAIIHSLSTERQTQISDGMDVGVIIINKESREVCYSAAKRPLLRMRKGELDIFQGTKRSIGDAEAMFNFETSNMPYESGDQFYIFSDGIPDQFGGPNNRKINRKAIQQMIIDVADEEMYKQKNEINNRLQAWQGDHPQTDDMVFLGIRMK